MPVLLVVALVLWMVVLVFSVILSPVVLLRRRARPRARALRVTSMLVAYLTGQCACLLACLALWLATGLGWRLASPWAVRAHRGMLAAFLGALIALSGPLFGFRVQIQEPDRHPEDLLTVSADSPLLVLARHAGPGASFALVHILIARYDREVHVVLKDTLRLDPTIDLLLTRTGCTWIPASRKHGQDPAQQVGRAAAALHGRQALLLFPEGADWTPVRQG